EFECAQQASAQPVQHVLKIIALTELSMSVKEFGDLAQRFQIFNYLLADVWPLYFDDDFATVAHMREVHLGQGGSCQRLWLEVTKSLRETHTDLTRNYAVHFLIREWFDAVLQTRECFKVGRRQEICPRRKQLTQLNERWTKIF